MHDLRLQVPVLEPSDDLVQRLASAARASRPTAPASRLRQRITVAVAAFLGLGAVSVGGAWAVGAIEVPGLPDSPLRSPAVEPREPVPPGGLEPQSGAGGTADADDAPVERDGGSADPQGVAPTAAADEVQPRVRPTAPGRPDDPGEQGRDRAKEKKGSGASKEKPGDPSAKDGDRGRDEERRTGRPDDAGSGSNPGQGDERRGERGRAADDESAGADE